MSDAAPSEASVTEWEPYEGPASPQGRRFLVLWFVAVFAPCIAVAALAGGFLRWAAVAVVLALAAWVLVQPRLLLSDTYPARPREHSRLLNLATGLARDLRMAPPRALISRRAGANAFVVPGALVVTEDLLATCTRTELEAVVAHCLIRLRDGGLGWGVAAATTRGSAGAAPRVDRHLDARVAAVTRYPPALASAISKATPVRDRTAPLWFVADARSHMPAEKRVAELLDL